MLARIRLRLAEWIAPKHWHVESEHEIATSSDEVHALVESLYQPDETSPQVNWRKTRAEMLAKRGK